MKKCYICSSGSDSIIEISDCISCHKTVCFICMDGEISMAVGDKVCLRCSKKYSVRNPVF